MQETSQLYQSIISGKHSKEVRLALGEPGRLITKYGDSITFGGFSILVGTGGANSGYDESSLVSVQTFTQLFSENTVTVGSCVSSEIHVHMLHPASFIPRNTRVVPYARVTDGVRHSEWLQKGVFYIDTRSVSEDDYGVKYLTIHGYDAMLKAEMDYPSSTLSWPAKDIDVVQEIATALDVSVDARTFELVNRGYTVQYPAEYSCRETLGYIAAMYGGCFTMSDLGELRLVQFFNLPKETRYLIDTDGRAITFGGVHINV